MRARRGITYLYQMNNRHATCFLKYVPYTPPGWFRRRFQDIVPVSYLALPFALSAGYLFSLVFISNIT